MNNIDEYTQEFEDVEELLSEKTMMDLFDELTFKEKWQKVFYGIKQPPDTGDYKFAKLQLQRLAAPISAVIVPILAICLMAVMATMTPDPVRVTEVQIMEPEQIEELQEEEEIPEEEPLEPPEPVEFEVTSEMVSVANQPSSVQGPAGDFSPQPAKFDTVAMVKSPVVMKGIYGSRNPGSRGSALAKFGGGGFTEGAVMRALRWLKVNQESDGSWPKNKTAMASLALLTYMAHGETPTSEEFGQTVELAIRFIVEHQESDGHFNPRDGHDYTHPIATYALCEAYGLTKVPMVKYAAEKAIKVVIKGQNDSGGFNYNLNPSARDDGSYMGWCVQALKAAYMAGIEADGLDNAKRKAVKGFQKISHSEGGFGYTAPAKSHGLTGVGVLCLQLLGKADISDCKLGLRAIEAATFNWEGNGVMNKNYYWYYITQAKFHAGGETWNKWNNLFSPVLVKHQSVETGKYEWNGKDREIGYWNMNAGEGHAGIAGHSDGDVMNTCLAALQLQVYYRYLPTFQKVEVEQEEDVAEVKGDLEINIEI